MAQTGQRKPGLSTAIKNFSRELKQFTQSSNEGLTLLKRTLDYAPNAGAIEFKNALSDLEEDVEDLSSQLQQLGRHTLECISFQELLGHCTGMYDSNRAGILRLEAHLKQYGYTSQQGLQHPENPLEATTDIGACDEHGELRDEEDMLADQTDKDSPVRLFKRAGVQMASGMATTTPHHVMSSAAKAKLRSRVKTPGMPLKGLLGGAFSDEDDEEEEEDTVMAPDQQQQSLNQRAWSNVVNPGTSMVPKNGASARGPSTAAAAVGSSSSGGSDAGGGNMGGRGPSMPGASTGFAGAGANTVAAGRNGSKPAGKGHTSEDSSRKDSMSPGDFGLLMSPSFAALQAKYGAGGIDASNTAAPAAAANPASNTQAMGQQQSGGSSAGDGGEQGHESSDEEGTPLALLPERGTFRSHALQGAGVPALQLNNNNHNNRGGAGSGLGGGKPSAPPSKFIAEEDTCSLYAQLIRSKDVPSSLAANSARGAAAAKPASTGNTHVAGGTQHGVPQLRSGSLTARPTVTAAGVTGDESLAVTQAPLLSERKERDRALTPFKQHELEQKLSSLENMWVASGQKALTPRRGSGASAAVVSIAAEGGVGAAAGAAVVPTAAPGGEGRAGAAHTTGAAVQQVAGLRGSAGSSLAGGAATSFAFAQPAAASQAPERSVDAAVSHASRSSSQPWPFDTAGASTGPGLTGAALQKSVPSAAGSHTAQALTLSKQPPHTGGAPHTSGSTITPALDSALLAKYASNGPTPLFSSSNLSPGTSQLLSRVFGTRSTTVPSAGVLPTDISTGSSTASASSTGPIPVSSTARVPSTSNNAAATVSVPAAEPTAAAGHKGTAALTTTTIAEAGHTPAIRPVSSDDYTALPSFLRSQLPLDQLNTALTTLAGSQPSAISSSSSSQQQLSFVMEDLEKLGFAAQKGKVLVNCLVKLGRAEMQGAAKFTILP